MEKLFDEGETVNEFSCLVDKHNSRGGFEAAVTARVRTGWVRFRESGELLLRNRLRMKGRVYHCFVRSAILYGSGTWCLKITSNFVNGESYGEAMCGRKVEDKKTIEEQMGMLGLKETTDGSARAIGVR